MRESIASPALRPGAKAALLILPLAAALLALCAGRFSISPADVAKSICNCFGAGLDVPARTQLVVVSIRLPRVLLAMLTGAGLSVAGCAFQSLFSNPLATPDTLGVASGASFGAALALLAGFGLIGVQLSALVFGIIAVSLTWFSVAGKGGMNMIILAGIMIGSLFSALVSLVKYTADTESQLPAITYWLMGSLGSASYKTLALGAPMIVLGIAVLFTIRWRLNILPLPEDEAKSLGTDLKSLRIVTVVCATAMTASCVSMCGQVGWVGLLVPHMCRMRFGSDHMSLIPASVSVGAVFMIAVDTIARSATASEIPISILTAMIGAPFFIFLMRRSGGWQM
jgi:iron complex transport system permease protein